MPPDRRYRTIVADPPWDHSDGTGWDPGDADHRRKADAPARGAPRETGVPYQCMSVDEIKALPVKSLAQSDVAGNRPDKSVPRDGSSLYLWTTTRYLEDAHEVARCWGFTPTTVLVWCKPERGFAMGGTFASNVEFVLVGRRGSPRPALGGSRTRWFTWPRGAHSAKPEAFLDLVEQVSPGPYLEMFARRARFGWDYWGDQSLGTAELAA